MMLPQTAIVFTSPVAATMMKAVLLSSLSRPVTLQPLQSHPPSSSSFWCLLPKGRDERCESQGELGELEFDLHLVFSGFWICVIFCAPNSHYSTFDIYHLSLMYCVFVIAVIISNPLCYLKSLAY